MSNEQADEERVQLSRVLDKLEVPIFERDALERELGAVRKHLDAVAETMSLAQVAHVQRHLK
jgi:hypothetical protein